MCETMRSVLNIMKKLIKFANLFEKQQKIK